MVNNNYVIDFSYTKYNRNVGSGGQMPNLSQDIIHCDLTDYIHCAGIARETFEHARLIMY